MKKRPFIIIGILITNMSFLAMLLSVWASPTVAQPQSISLTNAETMLPDITSYSTFHNSPFAGHDDARRLMDLLQNARQDSLTPANSQNIELVGQIGGFLYAVAAQGNYVYVGIGPRLVVLDVSNPSQPVVMGQTVVFPDIIWGIAVDGNYAYVTNEYSGLRVVDVSNPAAPTQTGFYDTPGSAWGVAVAGSYAYIADRDTGLRVVDVSNPAAPSETGFYDTPGSAWGVAVAGNYAYIADNELGLRVVDVSNPAAPSEIGFYESPGPATAVAVAGNYAYVADLNYGLRVVDVSNPAAPSETGFYDTPGLMRGLAVVGNYAYITDDMFGLRIVDVSNPAAPSEVGFAYMPYGASGVMVSVNYAYVVDYGSGLRIVDVSDPTAPAEVSFYSTPGDVLAVAVAGNYAYVTDFDVGLKVVDVNNPAIPSEIGFCESPDYAVGVTVVENYAYVADLHYGLRIVDVSDPTAPAEVGSYDTPGSTYGVAVVENYAYIADGPGGGLRIVNVSDPTAPAEAGFYDTPGSARGVAVAGNYAYVADGVVRIVDVSDPTAPTEAGFYYPPSYALGVAVVGSYVYVATAEAGLRVVDVSDPAAPTEVGFYDMPDGYALDVAVTGNYAYIADRDTGLRVVNVSDPAAPVEVGLYDMPGYAQNVGIAGSYAYVADREAGLFILRYIGVGTSFSISGQVTDGNGTPISGVAVSVGTGIFATTNSTGYYTITSLVTGTYTLIPSKGGWTFTPPTRTVTVPPDAAGQDFTSWANPVDPDQSTIVAEPITVTADGMSVSTITVTLRDVDDNPISGKLVLALSNRGQLDYITQPTAPTDANGQTVAFIRSTIGGPSQIEVIDATDGIWLSQKAMVTFIPPSEELFWTIDQLIYGSNQQLNLLEMVAGRAANNGDYFRGEIGADAAKLATDVVFGVTGLASDATMMNQSAFQLTLPGVLDDGWGDIFLFRGDNAVGGYMFNIAWQDAVRSGDFSGMGQPILLGGLKYFAANLLDTFVEEVTDWGAQEIFYDIVSTEQGLTDTAFPVLLDETVVSKQRLLDKRDELLLAFPPLNEAEQQAYLFDLQKRRAVPIILVSSLNTQNLLLESVRSARETEPTLPLLMYILKFASRMGAFTFFDGQGLFIVDGVYLAFDLHVDARKLSEDQRMYNAALGFMPGAADTTREIYLNNALALKMIAQRSDSNVATGQIESIANYSGGYGAGPIWIEKECYSDITLTNTSVTSDSIAFRVIATYAYDGGLFDMVYMPMVVEETVNLFSGQSETLRIFYKQGSQGGCPNQDSNITFDVLASNDSGTFYVGSNADQWNPQRVNPLSIHNASAISMATNGTLASNAPSIENPIDTHIFSLPGELQYEGQIWVVNPFTQSISTAITQPIPADINLLQFGDGILGESALTWQRDISAGQVEQITYTFQYLGAPGTPITFPSATMVLTEPLSNTFITIDAYPITFASSLPVVAEGHSPGRIVPGIMGSIPITVSNLLTDDIAIGSVALQITDTSGVLVYNDTQSFNLGPAVSQTLSFAWPTSLDKGRYITEVNLNYGSVKKIIFHDLIFVGLLPPQVTLASAPIGIVRPGDLISYTSRMTNTTGITLTNVIITATLPAGTTAVPGSISDGGLVGEGNIHWNFPELLQDQTTIVSFTVQINQNALDGKESDLVESEVWIESDRIFSGAPRATTWNLLLHPPPALTNIDPFQVPNNVSTTITIIGTGFLVTPTVTISSSLSLNATFVNSTTLTATVPAGLPIGVYTITVTNPDAQFSTLPSAITVYESVTAEFSGNPTSGTAPLTVNFTNLSTGNYDTCSWVFGDGITKKECGNPSHTYNTPGIYTVSLTMSGFGSSDVEVKEEYISISENYRVYLPIIIHDH